MALNSKGLTVYGNKKAFSSLRDWLSWIENSNETEHFECHLKMFLENDESKFDGKRPSNIGVLLDRDAARYFADSPTNNSGFELTFMAVSEADLDDTDRYQKDGLLPKDWER